MNDPAMLAYAGLGPPVDPNAGLGAPSPRVRPARRADDVAAHAATPAGEKGEAASDCSGDSEGECGCGGSFSAGGRRTGYSARTDAGPWAPSSDPAWAGVGMRRSAPRPAKHADISVGPRAAAPSRSRIGAGQERPPQIHVVRDQIEVSEPHVLLESDAELKILCEAHNAKCEEEWGKCWDACFDNLPFEWSEIHHPMYPLWKDLVNVCIGVGESSMPDWEGSCWKKWVENCMVEDCGADPGLGLAIAERHCEVQAMKDLAGFIGKCNLVTGWPVLWAACMGAAYGQYYAALEVCEGISPTDPNDEWACTCKCPGAGMPVDPNITECPDKEGYGTGDTETNAKIACRANANAGVPAGCYLGDCYSTCGRIN